MAIHYDSDREDKMSCRVCHLPVVEAFHRSGTPSNGLECPFCSAVFSRVDGAKRHAKRCPQREGRALHAGKRGRKKKSCDQCSRVKVHCNAQHPCDRCVSRKIYCTFSRYCIDASHRQARHEKPPNAQDSSHGRVPLSFLLNSTDNKQDFVTERAVGEEPDGTLLGPTCVIPLQAQVPSDETLDYIDPTLLFSSDPQASLMPLEPAGLYDAEEQSLVGALLSNRFWKDPLAARLDILEFHVAAHASSSDCHKSSFDLAAFRRFFSVSNVHKFAIIFCRKRHYRYPIIHWPTFALEEASLSLLMVVSLTGASYSYRSGYGTDHVIEARKLYYLADSFVFRQLETYLDGLPPEFDIAEAIQLYQAALLMYGLITLMASDSAIQHVAITKRLPALISAMRKLRFIGCKHELCEDWQLFLHREHIVRLVAWTFCADCLATLTCNNPPIFSMLEMSGDLPCDPVLWDTDSVLAFELMRSSRQGTSQCLKDLMSNLLNDGLVDGNLDDLPLFHLHIMLCGELPAHLLVPIYQIL